MVTTQHQQHDDDKKRNDILTTNNKISMAGVSMLRRNKNDKILSDILFAMLVSFCQFPPPSSCQ